MNTFEAFISLMATLFIFCSCNKEKANVEEVEKTPTSVCVWVAVHPTALDCMNLTINYKTPNGEEASVEVKKSDLQAVPNGSRLNDTVDSMFKVANHTSVKKEDLMAFCIEVEEFTEWSTDFTAHLTCKKEMPAGIRSWDWVQTAAFEVTEGALSDTSTFASPSEMTGTRQVDRSNINEFIAQNMDLKLASIHMTSADRL